MGSLVCAHCGVQFSMPDHLEDTHRREHSTFYCPNGHSQYFPGKTREEKRIAELELALERTNRRTSDRFHDLLAEREEWKRLARSCPICGEPIAARLRVPENIVARIADHLRFEHGAVERRRALPRGEAA